jgi:hypothetical protein
VEFANRAYRGIGQKGKGMARPVFLDDRQMRVEVGYGWGRDPDACTKQITSEIVKPRQGRRLQRRRGSRAQGTRLPRARAVQGTDRRWRRRRYLLLTTAVA